MYEGPAGSQALSRNLSYSHESVFQMDPYVVQVRYIHSFVTISNQSIMIMET